jgi:hypothetical protein
MSRTTNEQGTWLYVGTYIGKTYNEYHLLYCVRLQQGRTGTRFDATEI